MSLVLNVTTDLYLISIPLPMLWGSMLKPLKKMGLMLIFGSGFFVITCALLRSVLMLTVCLSYYYNRGVVTDLSLPSFRTPSMAPN